MTEPLELVGMDLVGKLTVTTGVNQDVCVMIDYFTKWTEACSLKSKTAAEVRSCILDFFYKIGAPKRLLTNQGSFCEPGKIPILLLLNQKVNLVILTCPSLR